jgi:hypothetical protein
MLSKTPVRDSGVNRNGEKGEHAQHQERDSRPHRCAGKHAITTLPLGREEIES